jgi:hypothetical protein
VPESFEVVVGTLIRREDVDDNVAVIKEDPTGFGFSFLPERLHPVLRDYVRDSFDNGLELADGLTASDHEIVGEGRYVTDVQQQDVLCLLLGGRVDYLARQLVWFQAPCSLFPLRVPA